MKRRTFLGSGVGAAIGTSMIPHFPFYPITSDPEQLDMELVKEFVTVGHSKLPRVKEMLDEYPNLISSRYDWGNGDYEEAIEGAAHVGSKDVISYLIGKGARINLFVLTTLGRGDLVIPTLEAYPDLVFSRGAHGLSLLHHAQVGGEDAADILEYVQKQGLTERSFSLD